VNAWGFLNPLHKYTATKRKAGPDPLRCPVQTTINLGRMSDFRQCPNKPKPDTMRPVRGMSQDEESLNVCGQHAGVYDRAKKKAEAFDAERTASHEAMVEAEAQAKRLSKLTGDRVEVFTRYDPNTLCSWPTGRVIIDAAALERLAPQH
jgi:hypothetical protein